MKNIFFILLLFIGFTSFSQSPENLKAITKKFYEANYLMDFDSIAFFSYPKMLEIIGAGNLRDKLEQHYENDVYRLRLQLETVPFQYGQIKKIEGKSFCVITFRNPMRYFFETKLTTATATEKTVWLKQINKTPQVTFEPNRNSFNVKKITTLVAIADETTNGDWKFFNFDDASQLEVFDSLFSESIKKALSL